VLDATGVAAALEGVGLDQLDAADRRPSKLQLSSLLPAASVTLARQRRHRRQVVRQVHAGLGGDQAGLGQVQALGRLVEQHHVALAVDVVAVTQQFQPHQRCRPRCRRWP
jgi:hypothetical protein